VGPGRPGYNVQMPSSLEHDRRRKRLQEMLSARGLEGALLLEGVDVYYFAATRQSGALFVPASGDPVLLVRRSVERACAESAIADVRPFPSSRELGTFLPFRGRLGTTFDAVPAGTLEWWRSRLPLTELVDVSGPLREQRSVKSPAELAALRSGGLLLAKVLAEVPAMLREGLRELDLSVEIESRLRRAGNLGSPRLRGFNAEMFMGLALSGDSAAVPGFFDGPVIGRGLHPSYPQGASERRIGRDEPILLDFTFVHDGYVADMTRMAVIGALKQDLARAFEVALAIQDEVARSLCPGVTGEELWERALSLSEKAGLGEQFMGPPGEQARFVGHGVGLELDELPVLAPRQSGPLLPGQVVAVEPKFVFPDRGAVGIENTWLVGEGGGEKLTGGLGDGILRAR